MKARKCTDHRAVQDAFKKYVDPIQIRLILDTLTYFLEEKYLGTDTFLEKVPRYRYFSDTPRKSI